MPWEVAFGSLLPAGLGNEAYSEGEEDVPSSPKRKRLRDG